MPSNGLGRNGRKQAPYVHKDWPAFFYGPNGQSQKFNRPDEVPDGWHDSPDKFDEDGQPKKGAKTEIPGYDEAVASTAIESDTDLELPEYDDITAAKIKERLDEMGVPYDSHDNKPELYKALSTAVEEARIAAEEE